MANYYFLTGCHQITCIHLTQQGTVEPEPLHSRQLYLQYLDMTDCYALEDQGLKVIVKNCPQLLHLYLRRCINITGKSIVSTFLLFWLDFLFTLLSKILDHSFNVFMEGEIHMYKNNMSTNILLLDQ